jgi:hypothetical protein
MNKNLRTNHYTQFSEKCTVFISGRRGNYMLRRGGFSNITPSAASEGSAWV